ncbi:hypothetical protein [Cellulomonas sp. IC4_254]|uniref:hypothetical protein n=1 Tax=Cellulomonas sp. IC4_254 TaxID=2714040 RepID=UPI0014236E31|nr:hypothetical protein [Cellulomonas sp. IC4_254]NHT16867.1 hypothetical protein [Cellulomonas sp. IC4_254]
MAEVLDSDDTIADLDQYVISEARICIVRAHRSRSAAVDCAERAWNSSADGTVAGRAR